MRRRLEPPLQPPGGDAAVSARGPSVRSAR
jgi:hypothetical protein